MIGFTTPWLLAALAVLPILWWLLRVTPPAPRVQDFPALGLLLGLAPVQSTPARTPWWLLLLRLAAAALAIVGLAGPVRNAPHPPQSGGPVLLIIDNGWTAGPDWADRLQAATRALAAASPAAAPVRLLTTAAEPDGTAPALGPELSAEAMAARLAALRPWPWPVARGAAAATLARLPAETRVIYVSDGVASDTAGDARFTRALQHLASISELRGRASLLLLRPPAAEPEQFRLRAETLPGHPGPVTVRAADAAGHILAETSLTVGADGLAEGALVLPPDLRNRVAALRLPAQASAGAVILLDEAAKRRPVGLVTQGGGQDTPLTGALFYLRRALAQSAELRSGSIEDLLHGGVSVIVLADTPVGDPQRAAALAGWVRRGGVLVRFAGPNLAAAPAGDPLLPVALLAGDRSLGGAMSWSRPAPLAPFPASSPFAALPVPDDIRVSRQVLAQPGDAADHPGRQDWAALADGTPLVTAAPLGAGRLVLFHVTANAEWSSLPLSGLFPRMLKRLVALSVGVRTPAGETLLPPRRALDGFGQLTTPGPAARPLAASAGATVPPGPDHPPGLYGPDDATRAFNLGGSLPSLVVRPPLPGATLGDLAGGSQARSYGPALLAAALLLLALDLAIALWLRGMLGAAAGRRPAAVLALLLLPHAALAQSPPPLPSLGTHLAYIVTGDSQADGITLAGLKGLSGYVNQRTSVDLAEPVGVDPGQDDLSFYPLLYWPVLAEAPVPDGATLARLDDYMANGGILVFDTRDAGAADPAADAAMQRIGTALALPALTPMTVAHVLSHTFYLLHDWPGRRAGGTLWVAPGAERSNDGVSPVILGSNDWAAAWATDETGAPAYPVIPGGEPQRVLAYRFGVNLVMYALTGNYKTDQSRVPELLRRLGQDPPPSP